MHNRSKSIGTNTRLATIFIIAALLPCIPAAAEGGKPLSPKVILDYVDDLYRSESSHGKITMKIVTEHWSRELSIEEWSMGKEKSLLRILSPKKEKGMATLRNGNDIWNYLPKVKRVIKLPSSMMSDSWMGSHFTNDDLVKESRMADDYTYELTFEGERDGKEILEITCVPRKDAVVVWGKLTVEVQREDFMPLAIKYFDEDLDLARTMRFTKIGELGGRDMPVELHIIPADEPDETTIVIYDEMEFDVDLKEDMFSLRSLKK